jgi:hypothetical protein
MLQLNLYKVWAEKEKLCVDEFHGDDLFLLLSIVVLNGTSA